MDKEKTIVTCYSSPDLDGLACAIAYSEYLNKNGQNAKAYIDGKPQIEAKFIADKFGIDIPGHLNDHDHLVLTDASNLNGFPSDLNPNKVIEIIDHRKFGNLALFPNVQKSQIEPVGAAATLITERFIANKILISRESAILLHQAIVSNTLNFQANVTTERDRIAAKWLKSQTEVPRSLTSEMFEAKSDMTGVKLQKNMLDTFAHPFKVGIKTLGIAQLEVIGAEILVSDRKEDIIQILNSLKEKFSLDLVFATIIDLEKGRNILISTNQEEEQILENIFNIKFSNHIATRTGLIMRKEIVPLILEQNGKG